MINFGRSAASERPSGHFLKGLGIDVGRELTVRAKKAQPEKQPHTIGVPERCTYKRCLGAEVQFRGGGQMLSVSLWYRGSSPSDQRNSPAGTSERRRGSTNISPPIGTTSTLRPRCNCPVQFLWTSSPIYPFQRRSSNTNSGHCHEGNGRCFVRLSMWGKDAYDY